MLNTVQLDQLAHLKSFIRAKAMTRGVVRIPSKVRVTKVTVSHTINPDSNIAKYPPSHLTSYNINYNAIIACGMVASGKPKRHDTFWYGKRGRKV